MATMLKDDIQAFGREVAAQFGADTCERYRDHHWAFAFQIAPRVFVFGSVTKGGMVRYSLFGREGGDQCNSAISVGVSASRGAVVAADQIRKRLLPDALPIVESGLANIDKKHSDHKAMTAWLEGMKTKYSRLKGSCKNGEVDATLYAGDKGTVRFTAHMGSDGKPHLSVWRVSAYGDVVLALLDLMQS